LQSQQTEKINRTPCGTCVNCATALLNAEPKGGGENSGKCGKRGWGRQVSTLGRGQSTQWLIERQLCVIKCV